jgi:hypothetical protein
MQMERRDVLDSLAAMLVAPRKRLSCHLSQPRMPPKLWQSLIALATSIQMMADGLLLSVWRKNSIRSGNQGADQSNFLSLFRSVIEAAVVFFTWPFLDGCMPLPKLAVKPS